MIPEDRKEEAISGKGSVGDGGKGEIHNFLYGFPTM